MVNYCHRLPTFLNAIINPGIYIDQCICLCVLSHFTVLILLLISLFFQAVDDFGVPGLDRVDSLAECLVELRNHPSLALTNQQVRIIQLFLLSLFDLSYMFKLFLFSFFSFALYDMLFSA